MRLINTVTRELEYFDHEAPPYYILSHRWTNEEVSYKDFHKHRVTQGLGYEKIIQFCEFALTQHPRWDRMRSAPCYVWIDTCAIDKRSSAELSEAINSMYRYYADAEICYVYLADVSLSDQDNLSVENHTVLLPKLLASEWFTRGWTLQELLAPRHVIFVDCSWRVIGHKCSTYCKLCGGLGYGGPVLNPILSTITGIGADYLGEPSMIETASIARIMSWAARRKTTRPEDEAYCLMGLFDINMPLLYGEGRKAFQRLQEEIIKHTTDMSIFAWTRSSTGWGDIVPKVSGILALRVSDFAHSGRIVSRHGVGSYPYTLTNAGLHLRTLVWPIVIKFEGKTFKINRMELNCSIALSSPSSYNDHTRYKPVDIALLAASDEHNNVPGPMVFRRLDFGTLSFNDAKPLGEAKDMSLYVKASALLDSF